MLLIYLITSLVPTKPIMVSGQWYYIVVNGVGFVCIVTSYVCLYRRMSRIWGNLFTMHWLNKMLF